MAKFLITGGNGFIGTHICKQLLDQPQLTGDTVDEIISVDINRSWVPEDKSLYKQQLVLRDDLTKDKVTRINCDTTNKEEFQKIIAKYKPEYIIHLAALPLANDSNEHRNDAFSTIYVATLHLLEIIRDLNQETGYMPKRFTFASSSMVYGDFPGYGSTGQPIPRRENDPIDPVKSFYATFKAKGEQLVQTYGYHFDIPWTIVRPSAVYGPTDANRRVSEIFVINALKGLPITIQHAPIGQRDEQFDFSYVTDTARGFILATTKPEGKGEVFNITAGNGRTLDEFVTILEKAIPALVVNREEKDMRFRPRRGTLDIRKAQSLLGYHPEHQLETGIQAYIDFINESGILKK